MSVVRLLALSLIGSACTWAQTSVDPSSTAATPSVKILGPSSDTQLHFSYIGPSAQPGTQVFVLPSTAKDSMGIEPLQPSTRCFTMRTYHFTREDPQSNAMKLDGYSTCQTAAKVQKKDAGPLR